MSDDLRRRVAAVERAVTDGETELSDVSDAATLDARLDDAERRLDELSTRLRTLDATTQALRGYLGGVDGVSAAVERRADLALAKAEALERVVFDDDSDGLAVERLPDPTETDDAPHARAGDEGTSKPTDRAADALGTSVSTDEDEDGDGRSLVTRLRDVL